MERERERERERAPHNPVIVGMYMYLVIFE
jgi:hypothetical protein